MPTFSTLHQDTFNRSNGSLNGSTMSDGLGTWASSVATADVWDIVSNRAFGTNGTDAGIWDSAMSAVDVQKAEATITIDDTGVIVRHNAGSTNFDAAYYMLYLYSGGLTLYIHNAGGAGFTSFGSAGTASVGDTLALSADGNTLEWFVNGTSGGTTTDSTLTTGRCGLYGGGLDSSEVDNFKDFVESSPSASGSIPGITLGAPAGTAAAGEIVASAAAEWRQWAVMRPSSALFAEPLSFHRPIALRPDAYLYQEYIWTKGPTVAADPAGSGSIPGIALGAVSGIAFVEPIATGSVPGITLAAPSGSSLAGALATGSIPGLTLAAPAGSALAGALAVGLSADFGLPLSAVSGAALAGALGTGSIPGISLTAPTGTALAGALATGSVPGVTLAAPTGSAAPGTSDPSASGSIPGITLAAPAGAALAGALAVGALANVSLTTPEGAALAGALASGSLPGIALSAPSGSAATGAADPTAVGALPGIAMAAPGGSAITGGRPEPKSPADPRPVWMLSRSRTGFWQR